MESAVDAGVIARNPCRVKGAGTERTTEMRAATPEEVAAIADAAGPRWRALILLAAYSGLRWGELGGLQQKHVDPLHRRLKVEQQVCEVNGRVFFGPPKTESAIRTVALPGFIVDEVVAHVGRFSDPGPEGLVFVMPEGGPLRRQNFRQRVWLAALRQAGVGHLRFHDLRHTGATLAAASGAPLKDLMKRLGHASAAAAIRYQHAVAGHDEAIAEFLDTVARQAATDTTGVSGPSG